MDGSGNVTLKEEDGIDYAPVTVQLPGGERVPFLFTIKELNAKGSLSGFGGDFVVPSYRGSSFLDPKVRPLAFSLDQQTHLCVISFFGVVEKIFKKENYSASNYMLRTSAPSLCVWALQQMVVCPALIVHVRFAIMHCLSRSMVNFNGCACAAMEVMGYCLRHVVLLPEQGRGGSTGYDNAVALPARADSEELAKENNKSTAALKGQAVFSVAKVPFQFCSQLPHTSAPQVLHRCSTG